MRRPLPDPEETIDTFADALADTAQTHGWIVGRKVKDGSDRVFWLHKGTDRIDFLAKLSQTEKGFWGLQRTRADEMVKGAWHLVLLTAATRGYVVRASQLGLLLSKASWSRGGLRINESSLKGTPYSISLGHIWNRLP